jgi:predicted DsbA family dithiol-disulfide isomerase
MFPLHPETPPEGRALEDLFAGRGYDLQARQAGMKARMEAEGLAYGPRTHTYNSRLAQELAAWASDLGGSGDVHGALYRAYFVDARNIGDVEVLAEVARSAGLDEGEARAVLADRTYREAVDADWAYAGKCGVTGVPSFLCEGRSEVGAQPYEALERLVGKAGARKRRTEE